MSYRDFLLALTGPPRVEDAPAESRRLGLQVGRVYAGPATSYGPRELARAVSEAEVDLAIVRYPADRVDWYAELARHSDHRVVFGESLLVQSAELPGPMPPLAEPFGFRIAGPGGDPVEQSSLMAAAADILEESFADYRSHYQANPYLPTLAPAQAYSEWIEGIVAAPGGRVLVWFDGQEPAGMLGVEYYDVPGGDRVGEIHLIGVRPRYRLRPANTAAFLGGHSMLAAAGARRVATVIQSHNLVAAKAVQWFGYRPEFTALTVHLVHPRLAVRETTRQVVAGGREAGAAATTSRAEHSVSVEIDRVRSPHLGVVVGELSVTPRPHYGAAAVGEALLVREAGVVVVSLPAELAHWIPSIEATCGHRAVLTSVDTHLRLPSPSARHGDAGELEQAGGPERALFTSVRNGGSDAVPWHWRANPLFDAASLKQAEEAWLRAEVAAGRAWLPAWRTTGQPGFVVYRHSAAIGAPESVSARLPPWSELEDGAMLRAASAELVRFAVDRGLGGVLVPAGAHEPARYRALLDMGACPVAVTLTVHFVRPEIWLWDSPGLAR